MTGVCLQEDVLFDEFTVYEMLKMFTMIKKIPNLQRPAVIQAYLSQFNLIRQQDSKCKDLSGGEVYII